MPGEYEFIDHTADIAIKATGRTLAEAFSAAAAGMFDIITDSSPIATDQEISIKVESIDLEGLAVTFLSELIVLHDSEGWLFGRFELIFESETSLTARLYGEKFDTNNHRQGTAVKGVSYHMMEIVDGGSDGTSSVTVLFDI